MAQMYDRMLNPERGYVGDPLLYDAKISANVLYPLRAGQVCHVNSVNELEPGVAAWQMPLFIFQSKTDLDVSDPAAGVGASADWSPMSPGGNVTCFVGKGSFELSTTEFEAGGTYLPNTPLRARTGNAAANEPATPPGTGSGILFAAANAALHTDAAAGASKAVVGLVSQGVKTNAYGKNALFFWSEHWPGATSDTGAT